MAKCSHSELPERYIGLARTLSCAPHHEHVHPTCFIACVIYIALHRQLPEKLAGLHNHFDADHAVPSSPIAAYVFERGGGYQQRWSGGCQGEITRTIIGR
jgi:hypothetical protein